MMVISPLTDDMLKKLSPGACRLLLAYEREPNASVTRCMEQTGYSRRWLKALREELEQAGVITAGKSTDRPSEKPDPAYQALVGFGVKSTAARELAQQHSLAIIQENIQYVRSRLGITNQAGYLVKRLRERVKESQLVMGQALEQAEIVQPASTAVSVPSIVSVEKGLPTNLEWQMLAYSVTVACGCDLNLNPAAAQVVQKLYNAGYTAEDVGYFLKSYWPTIWPGSRGEPPTLAALMEHIGHARHLLDMAAGKSRGDELLRRIELLREHATNGQLLEHPDDLLPPCTGDPLLSPYANHPRYRAWVESEHEACEAERLQRWADHCPTCYRSREACICKQVAAIPARIKDCWIATRGQLQIQLNRATYDTWVRHLSLAEYGDGELLVEADNEYIRDWVDRHLLASMTQTFNAIYQIKPSDPAVRIRVCQKPADPRG